MKIAQSLSTNPSLDAAAEEVGAELAAALGGEAPHLVVAFATLPHAGSFARLHQVLAPVVRGGVLFGCSASGAIGGRREVERGAALSVWAARLPGAIVAPLRWECREEGGGFVYDGWDSLEGVAAPAAFLLLVDPFSNVPEMLFDGLAERFGPVPICGGISRGGTMPGTNALFLGAETYRHGTVGVAISGQVDVRPVVSQGCRPLGRHYVVTEAKENVLYKIAGQPALARFQEVFQALSPEDRDLARRALHVGRVVDEYRDTFGRGDFLIRNCIGIDPDRGAILVNDRFRRGQTVQFHVRDAASATEDLGLLLDQEAPPGLAGALLFTCSGRGTHLFGKPDHDASMVQDRLGPVPLAGFFANGEIGPVAGRTCLHGFTASLALFAPATRD